MTSSIANRSVTIFLVSVLWSFSGCAKGNDQQSDAHATSLSQQNSASKSAGKKKETQTFGMFLFEFSDLIKTSNWKGLADITDFPLTIRGELDDEGSVEIDRKQFLKLIGGFFKEEVYLTINDKLVASTYRNIMIKPVDKPEINGNAAELHGFHFVRKNQHWKLKQITTYVHVVEKFAQGVKK